MDIPATMRAVSQNRFGGPEVLEVIETEVPEPLPTEVLVRVEAAGINPVDAKTRNGSGMAPVVGAPPFVLGWDVTGTVVGKGFGVSRFEIGDEVLGMPWFPRAAGAYAGYVTAPSRHFVRRPAGLAPAAAAGLPLAGLTAWQALVDVAKMEPGERVLVHAGSGGVGHLAVQIARARGAEVTATTGPDNGEFVRSLGADAVVNHAAGSFEDEISDQDIVLDLVGGDVGIRSLKTLKPGGRLVVVPAAPNEELEAAVAGAEAELLRILVEPDQVGLDGLVGLVEAGALDVHVSRTFSLDQAADAHRQIESGRTVGKLVLTDLH